ncbi:hypothetical protein SASPL_103904 [Salvia splendens]|uniref:CCR4-NOT transcription complex subunit 1 n=1 Tax=Salvia splendens TaxID=180675 RepID=A0A8X9A8K3_SALSN|nr:hypothetical protein SASPL_103904 [Salvia splendens]
MVTFSSKLSGQIRNSELLNEGGEEDFDAILAEMEKEISMADVMCELGYGCTANVAQCKEMLSLFLPLTDATVAKILGTVARTYVGLDDSQNVFATFRSAHGGNSVLDMPSLNSWNVDVLVDSIKQLALGTNWINVMENLDHEGFYIPNEAAFSFFMSVYKHACQEPFPLHAICGSVWKNVEGQLSFLKYAVSAPPEVFTFAHSERQLSYDDAVPGHTLQSGPNCAWSCHDLLVVLCQLSEMGHASLVRYVLESPLNNFPEVLLLGMAHVNTAYNLIQNEVASAVLPMALKKASASGLLYTLWHVNRNLLLRGLIDSVNLDPDSVNRIFDACQEIKECIKFLKDVQIGDQDISPNHLHPSGSLLNMYLEACPTVLKALQSHSGVLSSNHLSEEIEKLDVSHMRSNSRMRSAGGSDAAADSYAEDIETEANAYFHQMFSGNLSIDAMIQMLTRFKESPEERKKSIYECMIANLFEEYNFFSKYPERQLRIAAVLFDLVEFIERALNRISAAHSEPDVGHSTTNDHHHGLVQSSAPTMEPAGSTFSLIGPGSTQSGLPVSPSIPLPRRPPSSLDERKPSTTIFNHMKQTQSSSAQPVTAPSSEMPTLQKAMGTVVSGFGSALNIETLVAAAERRETPVEVPASEAQDKISFIINNLSAANVEAKAKEFSEILNPQFYPWFAQYMVMKRASIETNFHDLYLKFLDKVNLKPLFREIVQATYENCKVLVGSDLIKSSVEERSLLKNLGSWLGKITIGKNQAYEKGLMIAVIPFTSKILEPCSNSIAFQPPNPWTMAILGLLAEIYAMPNLKMNLKFEIEVLFKHLSVDLKDVTPTSLLKEKVREVEGNPDFSNKDVGSSQPPIMNEVKPGIISTLNHVEMPLDVAASPLPGSHSRIMSQYAAPLHHSSGSLTEDEKLVSLGFSDQLPSAHGLLQGQTQYAVNQVPVPAANIEQQVVVNKKLQAYGLHLHFQSVLPIAMDRAVKEIVSSIVQRSVSIATQTTKELVLKLENQLANEAKEVEIQAVIAEVPAVILRCISRDEAALAVAQKAFKGLYENASNCAHVDAHLAILAAIRDVSKLVVKELTSWVLYSEEDRKFNRDITIGLINSELLNLGEYNVHMAKLLDAGRNKAATEFAISLIQTLVMNDSKVISELHNLVDALAKACLLSIMPAIPGSPESLQQLIEIAKNPANAGNLLPLAVGKEEIARTPRGDKKTTVPGTSREEFSVTDLVDFDPAGFSEQVSALFTEWYQICELPGANDAACARHVSLLQQRGLLKGDEMTDRFFRRIMELSVSHCLSSETLSFLAIDIYAKLVFSVLKFFPADQGSSKLSLLPKVLAVTVKFILKDAEERKASFNPRPYFRLFVNWLLDLCSLDPVFDGANFQVLTGLANAFHAIQPLKVPGFSFAWLELVSHRSFMPKLLTANAQKGWPYFQRLLVDLFQFMEPFLRKVQLGEPVHFLYKGTLRVLLVLLHDFPEFLCDYHFSFCDVIPPSCIQMRNIILSAFPRNMRLPDPSTPNLKIDLLPEITQSPRILSEVDAALKAKQIKNEVDEYLKTRQQGSAFLTELKQKLLLSPNDVERAGTRYNVPLINSLVLYVGMQAQQLQAGHAQSMANMSAFLVSAALDIFQTLIMDLDTEGRYLFLNAVANQLRYPNNHTHYFSFILLYLFHESNQETIQEQITRVLLERLIVNRPHPWGLLITFIELIKNPRYSFWSRSFTRCASEIEKLFESVSRSFGGPKPVDDSLVSAGIPDNLH